jgi:hypothetical protein
MEDKQKKENNVKFMHQIEIQGWIPFDFHDILISKFMKNDD